MGENVKKKVVLTAIVSVITTIIVCAAFLYFLLLHSGSGYFKYAAIRKIVDDFYIGEYDPDKAETAMYNGFVKSLGDRYAQYYDKDEAESKENSDNGVFYGLGITVAKHPKNETMLIIHVYDGSSAQKSGLREGDEIIRIADTDVRKNYNDAYKSLRGLDGNTVEIEYLRNGKSVVVDVGYADCQMQSVYYHMIGKLGYVEITTFNTATVDQFKEAIDNLINQNAEGLIFDLRSNGGGTVDSVCEMLDYICPKGTLMSVEYANGVNRILATSDEKHKVDLPMAVLTDSGTASASELFSANIRDFKKGVLVGSKTYGKGVMQSTYDLSDGSALKVTVAKFFPHGGVNFDGEGLSPDIPVELTAEEKQNMVLLKDLDDPVVRAAAEWFETKK